MDDLALHRRRGLLDAGFTDAELRQLRKTGELTMIRRGNYLAGPEPDDDADRHRLLVGASLGELAHGAVLSHASAAVMHGLPVWGMPLDRVSVTRDRRSGARRSARVHMHAAPLGPDDLCEMDGFSTTSIARTVLDVARSAPFEAAIVTGDAAVRLITSTELASALAEASRRPGCARARRAVGFMNGLSESVGESRSRVAIALAGLPPPVPQWEVRSPSGRFIGRTDFAWPEHGVLGEFDGKVKYGRLLGPGQAASEIVYREKLREDELRAEGFTMVRWTWQDLAAFAPVAARLRRALG
ncbi:hypothetical protein [Pseudonocardia spinosispora]|uniref:hypothetical protein n=1 Tax=Pseudonocardia spinosispora TaxID=103441 RepID=UPI00048FB732|nr:hypothetical protein [Pseudonocardia spinosispora]